MRGLGLRPISIILITLLLSGSIGAVYAQSGAHDIGEDPNELRRLRLRAEVLQRMLERSATIANISESLQNRISVLLSQNLTALSLDELKQFVADAKSLLREIKDVRGPNATESEHALTLRLLERIRLRVENALRRMNVTGEEAEEIREKLREALRGRLTVKGLAAFMKEIRGMLAHRRALELYENAMSFAENATRFGAIHGLETALNASCKVLEVLEAVKERLERVNASPVAVTAIEHAIERITLAREVLEQVMERLLQGRGVGNVTRGEVTGEVESVLEEKLEDLNETISRYLEELKELRGEAEEANLTDVAERLNETISMLKELSSQITSTNISFGDVMRELARAKRVISHAERVLEEVSEEEELRSQIYNRLIERINEVREKLEDLRRELEELVGQEGAGSISAALSLIEGLVEEAQDSLQKGDLRKAIRLLNKAEQMIRSIENKIERLKRMQGGHPAHGGPEAPSTIGGKKRKKEPGEHEEEVEEHD